MNSELPGARPRMRMLFISSDKFPPFRVDVKILFAKKLLQKGYRIDWLLQSETACLRDYSVDWGGGTAWVAATDLGTGRWARVRKHLLSIRNDWRLFRLVKKQKYDIVQVKDKFIAALLAQIAARKYEVKVTYWLSYPFPEESLLLAKDRGSRYPVYYWLRGMLTKWLLYRVIIPLSDHCFVQSEQMKRDLIAYGVESYKLTAVPMGIDETSIDEQLDDNDRRRPGEKMIVYLGTLIKVRRLDFLVRSFAVVRRACPEARLYMVGEGDDPSDMEFLVQVAEQAGVLNQMEFTGFLPSEEAWSYVRAADVCLSPFYPTPILNSTSPTKLVEYLAFGKPVVANDHPEQKLVIEESGAGICVPWKEEAFADAILDILRDPPRAREMGKRGREYVLKNRTYGRIADAVDREYLRITGCDRSESDKA